MNDFLTGLLVKLWDTFKTKNAKLATLILLVVGTIIYFADQGTLLGVIVLPASVASVIKWLGGLYLILQAPHTSEDMSKLGN